MRRKTMLCTTIQISGFFSKKQSKIRKIFLSAYRAEAVCPMLSSGNGSEGRRCRSNGRRKSFPSDSGSRRKEKGGSMWILSGEGCRRCRRRPPGGTGAVSGSDGLHLRGGTGGNGGKDGRKGDQNPKTGGSQCFGHCFVVEPPDAGAMGRGKRRGGGKQPARPPAGRAGGR